MRFCVPASLGMVVPVTAMSEREPPTWRSSDLEDIFVMFVRLRETRCRSPVEGNASSCALEVGIYSRI